MLFRSLKGLAEELESDAITIDDAIKKYGEAIKLTEQCFDGLKKADTKLKVLLEKGEKLSTIELSHDIQ